MGRVIAIIPARLGSKRLPGKLVLAETGKPLIQHTFEAVCRSSVDEVYITSSDCEILSAAVGFGAPTIVTGEYQTGTERVAAAAAQILDSVYLDEHFVLNVQADEPEIQPQHLNSLIELVKSVGSPAKICTLVCPMLEEVWNSDNVKVACALGSKFIDKALYFSRNPIPWFGDIVPNYLKHIGAYAFNYRTLKEVNTLPQTKLESIERLEQLRWLCYGYEIYVKQISDQPLSVNSRYDYDCFVRRYYHDNIDGA
jgi:3-deoxy-manno-octulosonate cytidylyltransferase (CMP-KDO synthetase)